MRFRLGRATGGAVAWAGAGVPHARMMYAAARAARLEVSVATLAVRVALLSISCDSMVRSLVVAAARHKANSTCTGIKAQRKWLITTQNIIHRLTIVMFELNFSREWQT